MKIFHIFILILLFAVVGCQEESNLNESEVVEEKEEEEVVVVFVNGVPITEEKIEEYREVIEENFGEDYSEEEIYEAAIQDAITYEITIQYLEEKGVEVTEEDVFQARMKKLYAKLMDEIEVTEEDVEDRYAFWEQKFEEEERSIFPLEEISDLIEEEIREELVQEKIEEVEKMTEELVQEKTLEEANKEAILLITGIDLELGPTEMIGIGLFNRFTKLREEVEVSEEDIKELYQEWERALDASDSETELLPLEEIREVVHREVVKEKAEEMMYEELSEKKEMAEIEIVE